MTQRHSSRASSIHWRNSSANLIFHGRLVSISTVITDLPSILRGGSCENFLNYYRTSNRQSEDIKWPWNSTRCVLLKMLRFIVLSAAKNGSWNAKFLLLLSSAPVSLDLFRKDREQDRAFSNWSKWRDRGRIETPTAVSRSDKSIREEFRYLFDLRTTMANRLSIDV